MKRKFLAVLLAAAMVMGLAGCGAKEAAETTTKEAETATTEEAATETEEKAVEAIEINVSVPDPETSSIGQAAAEFAKEVNENSKGSLNVTVYYEGSLYGGDAAAGIKQLQAGGLDIAILATSLYASFNPGFNVINVPYLFDDTNQLVSYLNSDTGSELMSSVGDMGIKCVGAWPRSFRQITNSKTPVNVPDDLKNMILRVPNNTLYVEFFSACGASCTPMSFSEVYNALQMNTLDGQENPVDVPVSNKFYEVQKYISMTNHMADVFLCGINQDLYDSLSDEQKEVIEAAGANVQQWKLDYDATADQEAIKTLQDNGMEVNELTAENKEKFVAVSKELYPTFKELVGNDELFDATITFCGK